MRAENIKLIMKLYRGGGMKRVEKITNEIRGAEYPIETRIKLRRFGCNGFSGNFDAEWELSEENVGVIGEIISRHDGRVDQYMLWFCKPINGWRLVFGRS